MSKKLVSKSNAARFKDTNHFNGTRFAHFSETQYMFAKRSRRFHYEGKQTIKTAKKNDRTSMVLNSRNKNPHLLGRVMTCMTRANLQVVMKSFGSMLINRCLSAEDFAFLRYRHLQGITEAWMKADAIYKHARRCHPK